VANLQLAATADVRQTPVVEVARMGGGTTEFIANQTLIRPEERLALAVHHPAAIALVKAVQCSGTAGPGCRSGGRAFLPFAFSPLGGLLGRSHGTRPAATGQRR
jgi:hypothetical protein